MSLTRARAFAAVDNISCIAKKARFCQLTNFFERKVSAYQVAVQGEVASTRHFDRVYLAHFHREERKHECSHSSCCG